MKVKENSATKDIRIRSIKITDLIDYREGSVVSREIIKNRGGRISVFAFDKDESLVEHVSPYDAVVLIVDGEAEIVISGKPHHLKINDLVVMPAREPHALKAIKRFKMMLTMIYP